MDRASHGGEYDLRVRVDADPDARIFNEAVRCALEARVCGRCGYTEFYAVDPASRFEAWRRSQGFPIG
jgi:hypothetical protein